MVMLETKYCNENSKINKNIFAFSAKKYLKIKKPFDSITAKAMTKKVIREI